MKLLFICNQHLYRSPTAEEIFRGRFETDSAGLYNETPVTAEQLEWADVIVVMEEKQRIEIARRFPEACLRKRLLTLGIPDHYYRDDPRLIEILETKMKSALTAPSRGRARSAPCPCARLPGRSSGSPAGRR